MHKLLPLLLLFFGLIFQRANAQNTSCAQTLRLATSTYEQGRLHELPGLLESCLKSGFTQQERVTAYKLLTLSYIYLEEPEKADENMLKLLQTDHYFEINPAVDPAEFVALYKTFRTKPIYRIGGRAGAIATQPNVTQSQRSNLGDARYTRGYGFTAGLSFEIPFKGRLTFNPELVFSLQTFNYKNTSTQISGNPSIEGEFTTNASHTLNYVSIPLLLQYDLINPESKKPIHPFVSLGIAPNYLFSASAIPDRKLTGNQPLESKSYDTKSNYEKIDLNILAALGLKYRFGGGYIQAEVRYRYGLFNTSDPSLSYKTSEMNWNYHYTDGIFKLNSLQFTLGYAHNVFNPKKNK